jgi:hypothetical protein
MTIVLDNEAFPFSETDRLVEAHNLSGDCYGSTILRSEGNTAMAVWGDDPLTSKREGLLKGEAFNLTLEYETDAIVIITTAARDTTLSVLLDELTELIVQVKTERDSLQVIVNNFPDTQNRIAELTDSLSLTISISDSLASDVSSARAILRSLITYINQ